MSNPVDRGQPFNQRIQPNPYVPSSTPSTVRSTNRRFLFTLSGIILVFLLLGGGLLWAGYNTAQAALQPAQAAQTFCTDLQSNQYSAAYALLSATYQQKVTATQFAQLSQLQDQVDGKIRGCPTASGNVIDLSFNAPKDHTAFLVTILRNKAFTGHIALVQQAGDWKVDAVEQTLMGTNLGPITIANNFCSALIKSDFNSAYQILSTRQQQLATEQQFAQQFTAAFGGAVKLSSCTVDYGTEVVQAGAATLNVTFNLTIAGSSSGTITTKQPTILTFRLENNSWRLDEFMPQTPAN